MVDVRLVSAERMKIIRDLARETVDRIARRAADQEIPMLAVMYDAFRMRLKKSRVFLFVPVQIKIIIEKTFDFFLRAVRGMQPEGPDQDVSYRIDEVLRKYLEPQFFVKHF